MGRKISSLVIMLNIKASPSFSLRWRSSAQIFLKLCYVPRSSSAPKWLKLFCSQTFWWWP